MSKSYPHGTGKATLGLHVARHMVAAGHWESAHMADVRVCVSASEAAYQLLAGATLSCSKSVNILELLVVHDGADHTGPVCTHSPQPLGSPLSRQMPRCCWHGSRATLAPPWACCCCSLPTRPTPS
jgi:hypothetical protein